MPAARKANPVPASTTVSALAITVRGTTSPKPSVKNVVPLMYTSDQNPIAPPPTTVIAEPAAHCRDRKSTRLNSSHSQISYAVFCLKKKKQRNHYHDCYPYRCRLYDDPSLELHHIMSH